MQEKKKWAVLVTGSRSWSDGGRVKKVLETYPTGTIVMHGGASGADSWAGFWAPKLGMVEVKVPYVNQLGKAGGPVRNRVMGVLLCGLKMQGYSVKVIAFHPDITKSAGTKDMVKVAKMGGIQVNMVKA